MHNRLIPLLLLACAAISCINQGSDEGVCGDSFAGPGEDCDGEDLAQRTCMHFDYIRGVLQCHTDCTYDFSECISAPLVECGNGILEDGEECDTTEFVDKKCPGENSQRERLCDSSCSYNDSLCNASDEDCTPTEDHQRCHDNDAYWYNKCGEIGELIDQCTANEICSVINDRASCESACRPNCPQCLTTTIPDGCGGTCRSTCQGTCQGNTCDTCTDNDSQKCDNNDVYNYDSCGVRGSRVQDCPSTQRCVESGNTASCQCTDNDSQGCDNGDVYNYNSCGERGSRAQNCPSNQRCVESGNTASCQCTDNDSQGCDNNDVYNYDSCGVRGSRVQDCPSTQRCVESGNTASCQGTGDWCDDCSTNADCLSGWSCSSWRGFDQHKWCRPNDTCQSNNDCSGDYVCSNSSNRCVPGISLQCSGGNVWQEDVCGHRLEQTDACASDEMCVESGNTASCQSLNYWSPPTDTETDSSGRQSNTTINVGIRIEVTQDEEELAYRACKTSGTFSSNIAFSIRDGASNLAYSGDVILNTQGRTCSPWYAMNGDANYRSGQQFGGIWMVVSPSTSRSSWGSNCSVSQSSTGTCWNGVSITMTRNSR